MYRPGMRLNKAAKPCEKRVYRGITEISAPVQLVRLGVPLQFVRLKPNLLGCTFDATTELQCTGDEPAEECPHEPGQPAGEDVGWKVNAEVDARQADSACERDGDGENVHLQRAVRDDRGKQRAHREINDGGKHRVTAGEA